MGRRLSVGLIAVAALLTAFLAGCNALVGGFERSGKDVANVYGAAQALVPAGAEILSTRGGACRELAAYPSCVFVYFEADGSLDQRSDSVASRAASGGWQPSTTREGEGGTQVIYTRDGLVATIWLDARTYGWREQCARGKLEYAEREQCADSISVHFN